MPQASEPQSVLPTVLIVAGPTCSGKSALAGAIAETFAGSIINADAMQIYRELPVLTACPDPEERSRVPHALYNVLPASAGGSAAWWRAQACTAIDTVLTENRLPILCGGTGLYLQALCHGLADIPDPGETARAEARTLLSELGAPALHRRLMEADPDTAASLRPSDGQRLARAWEVWRGTGHGLKYWWTHDGAKGADYRFVGMVLDPDRESLREAIPMRFGRMIADGALGEVRALQEQQLDPALPAMRALGVPQLLRHLEGTVSLSDAIAEACQATIRYTKRQATWFRHRHFSPKSDTMYFSSRFERNMKFMEKISADFLHKILNEG